MIEFIPYGKQAIFSEDREEVTKILQGDWITTGPKVKEFEQAVAAHCQVLQGVAVSNGTAALDLAIQALELPPQSEIITTPFTFIATINAILFNNHVPVLADIKPDTYNLNPDSIRQKITSKTKAIVYVNYAGQPCSITELQKIAQEHQLYLIEDSAQALGATYKNKPIGQFADMSTLSFHPVKHITTGEGGMILTNNSHWAKKLKLLRNHGMDKDIQERFGPQASWFYDIHHLARNYRITDFQCALGLSQLKKLSSFLQRRTEIAKKYTEAFQNHPKIQIPFVKPEVEHAWHLYPILLKGHNRNLFFTEMRKRNIGVNVHHIPPYKFTYHQRFGWKASDLPITEDVFNRTITLPIHPKLTENQQNYVIQSVRDILDKENQ